jgi:hypothetical protein
LLRTRGRAALEALKYDTRDPTGFFAEARTNLDMMGMTSDASSVTAVWPHIPQNVKVALVAAGHEFPSWGQLRTTSLAMAAVAPPVNKGRKPKCATCGKRHSGTCRSKN